MSSLDFDDIGDGRAAAVIHQIVTHFAVINRINELGLRLLLGCGENLVDDLDGCSHKIGLGFGHGGGGGIGSEGKQEDGESITGDQDDDRQRDFLESLHCYC